MARDTFMKREGRDYVRNFFRYSLYDPKRGQYLVTVDDGRYLFLDTRSFQELKRGKITDENLFGKLEDTGIIITENNLNLTVEKTRQRYRFLMNGTSLHIIVPTIRCNQSCPYCFASPKHITDSPEDNDMTEETARRTVEFIMQSPSSAATLEFTGGEATIRFDLVKLMTEYARELNRTYQKDLKVTIVTNLSMMNDEVADWLIDHDVTICTSLDGPQHVHDYNRMVKPTPHKEIGTHNSVVYWIERINEKYRERGMSERVNALMTITNYALPYYKEIIDEYVRLGLGVVYIRPLTLVGRATERRQAYNWYPREAFVTFYENCLNYLQELWRQGYPVDDVMTEQFRQKIIEQQPSYNVDYESPWGAGTGAVAYNHDGSVYACHEAVDKEEFLLGNVFDDTWDAMFRRREAAFTVLSSMLENDVLQDRSPFKPFGGTNPLELLTAFGKLHVHPSKTTLYHETNYHCRRMFDAILERHLGTTSNVSRQEAKSSGSSASMENSSS